MEAQIKLGRVLGVQIGLHYSSLLIATLLTMSLSSHFQARNPDWSRGLAWSIAVMTAVLFFSAILLHELARRRAAQHRDVRERTSRLITPNEVKSIPRANWLSTTVQDAMRPLNQLKMIGPGTTAVEALELLARENVNQLPVVSDGRLEGIVSREHILQALVTRRELDM
jgi:CBS-domain-containing membrane protein